MSDYKSIPVQAVAVVAEMTTPSGPLLDDHLLVCVLRDGNVHEISLGSVDGSPWLVELENRCGKLDLKLGNSTEFSTRIIYPPELREQPLMIEKTEPCSLKTIWRRLRLLGMDETETALTPEVMKYLSQAKDVRS